MSWFETLLLQPLLLLVLYAIVIQYKRESLPAALRKVLYYACAPVLVYDTLQNLTIFCLVFLELPKKVGSKFEFTLSDRLARLVNAPGWRGWLADKVRIVLDYLDPTGSIFMKLTEDLVAALKLVSGLFYAAAAAVFAMLTTYVAVPTGIYTKLTYDFWLVAFWLLVLGQFGAYKLPHLKTLKLAIPMLGLWAWVVLWTATVVSYGLSFAVMPYTLAILLDAVILASILQAKR